MFLLYITVLLTVGVIKDDDFTNSWGVWGNFNILCLDSLPCPSILGEKGKIAPNSTQNVILVKTVQVSLYPFGGNVVDSYKFHFRALLSLYYHSLDGTANEQMHHCYGE